MRTPIGCALALAVLGRLAGSQGVEPRQGLPQAMPQSEGPLDNDVYVPVDEAAARALASGDQSLSRARATGAGGAETERFLDIAFDAWHQALSRPPGTSVWFAAGEVNEGGPVVPRLAESVHSAVRHRLAALLGPERARWTARFEPGAQAALAAQRDYPPVERGPRLAELARTLPNTAAAARAALELGDLALESGLHARARGWYSRASLEAELIGDSRIHAAAEARRARIPMEPLTPEAWSTASACDFVDSVAWPAMRPGRREDARGERWLRPGGAFLADGRFALQTASELRVLGFSEDGKLEDEGQVSLSTLLAGYAPDPGFEAPREPPGWPLLPAADELGVVLVAGRTRRDEPNALVAIEVEAPSAHRALGLRLGRAQPAGRLAWAVVGDERLDASGLAEAIPELEALADFEFQPGPVLSGDRVLVQARVFDGQVRSWILAFDRRDGSLAWMRLLAGGGDRVATARFAQPQGSVAGQPLLACMVEDEPRVFVGTHLGLGVWMDVLLGEPLWSLKNRRRGEHATGWSGDRPLLSSGGSRPVILWGPMDSDRLYALEPASIEAPGRGGAPVLVGPPTPLGDARMLLGGNEDTLLVLGSAGRERTVSALRAGRDRIDALDLGRDERFRGTGLVSPERVWVSTNRGLYLFDRARELYLLDYDPLPPTGGEDPGGDVYALDSCVLIVGSNALWSFRVR